MGRELDLGADGVAVAQADVDVAEAVGGSDVVYDALVAGHDAAGDEHAVTDAHGGLGGELEADVGGEGAYHLLEGAHGGGGDNRVAAVRCHCTAQDVAHALAFDNPVDVADMQGGDVEKGDVAYHGPCDGLYLFVDSAGDLLHGVKEQVAVVILWESVLYQLVNGVKCDSAAQLDGVPAFARRCK